jgi:methylglyoxal synthase
VQADRAGRPRQQEARSAAHALQSGPLGGDQQIGAAIAEGRIDFLVFFWDPLEPQPHDPDDKALLRIAVVRNIPDACNRATADYMISTSLKAGEYGRLVPDYKDYHARSTTPMRGPLFRPPAVVDPVPPSD